MKEKAFSKQIRDDIKALYPDAHVYLIQDSYRTGRKPYDFYVVLGENFMAFECKVVKGKSVDVRCVTEKQIASLKEVRDAGRCGVPFVAIHSDFYKRVFAYHINGWLNMIDELKVEKSILLVETIDYSMTTLPRIKIDNKLRWDVRRLMR